MKMLVTGGTGFLGGHLIPRLVANGHEVLALSADLRGVLGGQVPSHLFDYH